MPIAFRLGEEWADLWERLKEQEGVGATELFKLQMKTFAILKSVDDSGKPLKITVHLPTGEDIDFRELLKISDADEAA